MCQRELAQSLLIPQTGEDETGEGPLISQYSLMTETGEPHSQNAEDCGFGGGSILSGTLELLAIDESEVRFRVEMPASIWNASPSGEYTAIRCR